MEYLLLIVGLVLLTISADWLVDGASGLAKRINVSDLIIGLTVVAFGTSAPELVVNIIASINGTSEIAITNILGSNMINTLVILGITAIIYPITCKKNTKRIEIPLSILAGVLILLMGTNIFGLNTSGFKGISRLNGVVLFLIFLAFMYYSIHASFKDRKNAPAIDENYVPMKIWKATAFIIIGLAGLISGGDLIVNNAQKIAVTWGVPESIIGVTIVALGTSLPELATSVVAALKKNTDLAIGNVIGSNIMNVFFILGLSSMIHPLDTYKGLPLDASMAGGSSLLVLIFVLTSRNSSIKRSHGIILLFIYIVYLIWLIKTI